jgi:glycosyltransferase involved in cell wall biosynthesis
MKNEIRPLLDHPLVSLWARSTIRQSRAFAKCLCAAVSYRLGGTFCFVMIEAMACGNADGRISRRSVREIIEMVSPAMWLTASRFCSRLKDLKLRPPRCRRAFEERFSARRMAHDYVETYRRIIKSMRGADDP